MPGAFERSIRRIAVAILLLAVAAPAYAEVPPPDPHSGLIGLIVYWIKLILHGEWGTLFSSVLFLVVIVGGVAGAAALLGLFFKPIEKMIEREREKEKERRLRLGIVTPLGGKSTFPINAVLLVRGIKAALGGSAEEPQASETAGSTGSRNPWEAARKAVETDAPPHTVKSEIKANPGTTAPAGRPATAALNEDAAKPIPVDYRSAPALASEAAVPKKSVFISYRRHDSGHITGRIYDRLVKAFGEKQVFFDVDSPMLGIDFREHIREKVSNSAVCLAVIGRQWNPLGASGQPRLSESQDRVRIEIELALERGIPVIPVLVDEVEVPAEKDLPQSIAGLAYRNAVKVRTDPDFHHDMDRLVRGIEQHFS